MARVYLAGKMGGLPDWNRPQFKEVEQFLTSLGHRVFNPSLQVNDHNKSGIGTAEDYRTYMPANLEEVAKSDFVAALPEWYTSRGATLEVAFATLCGVPVRLVVVASLVIQNEMKIVMEWGLSPPMKLDFSLLGERMGSLGWFGVHLNATPFSIPFVTD